MRKYSVLPHTADLRVRIEGSSLEELFYAGVQALATVLAPHVCESDVYNTKEEIHLSATNRTELLVDFLSEVLARSYIKKAVFCQLTVRVLTETKVSAIVEGVRVNSFSEDIKAVTYHEAEVERNERGIYKTIIVLDV